MNSILAASPNFGNGPAEPLVGHRRHAKPPHARALHCMSQPSGSLLQCLFALFDSCLTPPETGRQSLAAQGGQSGTGTACSLVTQQLMESHQPGEHVKGDVITVEDTDLGLGFPDPICNGDEGSGGRLRYIFVIARHQSEPENRSRRHVSFAPVPRLVNVVR